MQVSHVQCWSRHRDVTNARRFTSESTRGEDSFQCCNSEQCNAGINFCNPNLNLRITYVLHSPFMAHDACESALAIERTMLHIPVPLACVEPNVTNAISR
ncbi:hypothetical protein F441_14022 [Phytophthora nicotianae CJ01A1]|uniref:Uncharacterized protein n=5 Tax=Phytophthora nicotianae TaxID=4792 RepID=V9EPX9_PHYNI|nr:hypothetical protein F443_14093 [Phytophthora nicotianae P1569]ETO69199.1 hypothetical protein F444_14124 [Phytophthora nicotianae P1976]ETP10318.1 hypothetical protein F441_14022 [Phytophthora nicotianae CJ01A1]ETP38461.1 hypothetical protein F442_13939 [Phytophthora nicotianae P10297]